MPSGSPRARNWSAGSARLPAGTCCCSTRCGPATPAPRRPRYRAVIERGNDRLVEAHYQFWPSEEAMSEGSPQLILERGETVDKPPALIMQGTADDNLTPDMAADFAAAYTKAGAPIAYHKSD